ncbi:MAG: hypothetical protein J5934_01355 [Succinivibrio sp.]|nr:hypothetical protein [Succinivibrio sp.]
MKKEKSAASVKNKLKRFENALLGNAEAKGGFSVKRTLSRINDYQSAVMESRADDYNSMSLDDFEYWCYVDMQMGNKYAEKQLMGLVDDYAFGQIAVILKKSDKSVRSQIERIISGKGNVKIDEFINELTEKTDKIKFSIKDDHIYPIYYFDFFILYIVDYIYKRTDELYPYEPNSLEIESSEMSSAVTGAISGLFVELLNNLYRDVPLEEDIVIRGVTPIAAYRIAMSYYRGNNLPCDRKKAYQWIVYAAAVGEPRAMLAYLAIFSELPGSSEIVSVYDSIVALLNAYLCETSHEDNVRAIKADWQHFLMDEYTYNGHKAYFSVDLMSSIVELMKFALSEDYSERATQGELFSEFDIMAVELTTMLKRYPENMQLLATVAEFYRIVSDIFKSSFKENLEKLNIIKNARELTDDAIIRKLLEPGLQVHDINCESAFVNSKAFKFDSTEDLKILEHLLNVDLDKITSSTIAKVLVGSKQRNSRKIIKMAAASGNGYAIFEDAKLDIAEGKTELAVQKARLAKEYGIEFANFVLYQALKDTSPSLAYTYLRYAAHYAYPPAIKELADRRADKSYNPLPFMKAIEELEALADTSWSACSVMAVLYDDSGILPCDQYMSMYWIRKSYSIGNNSAFDDLSYFYNSNFDLDSEISYLPSINNSLIQLKNYVSRIKTTNDKNNLKTVELLKNCYAALRGGETELEQEIFCISLENGFWNKFGISDALISKGRHYYPVLAFSYCAKKYIDEVAEPDNEEFLFNPMYMDKGERRLEILETGVFDDRDDSLLLYGVKAVTALRPFAAGPDYEKYRQYIKIAARARNLPILKLNCLHLDALFADEKTAVDDAGEFESDDILISRVSQ